MGKRLPLYGGKRGIQNRAADLKIKFADTAEADLAHDFGENVPDRDQFTGKDLERFEEITRSYGISKFTVSKAAFTAILGSNPYRLLKASLPAAIFPSQPTQKPRAFHENESIVNLLNNKVDYEAIKNIFKQLIAGTYRPGPGLPPLPAQDGKNKAIKLNNITFDVPGGEGTRTYEVSGVLMKDKLGAGVLNIASRFELLTGGMTNSVALIVDASGGLSMSSLINSDIGPLPTNKMNFYILENIENESDSATKLKNFDRPTNAANIGKQPNLFFLKDDIDTVLYPKFNLDKGENDGEMLFGNADLVLSRAGDEMEADFTFPDGKTYHIENVSQNANVKNASLNIVASILAKKGAAVTKDSIRIPPEVDEAGRPVVDRTPYLFPYIKRVGDWCQALSLLDGARKYSKLDEAHVDTGLKTSLDELRKEGAAIGLLTLDRILLGYALALGIDVFFTTAPDLRLLLYFRNTETQLSPAELTRQLGILQGEFDGEYATIGKDNVAAILDQAIASVRGSTTPAEYIMKLRGALYRISLLRTDFAALTAKVEEIRARAPALSEKEKYDLYFEGKTLLRRLKADETHNTTQLGSLATYPALVDEKQQLAIIDRRPASRGSVEKIRVVVTKDILNDANQTKRVFEKYNRVADLKQFVTIGIENFAGTPEDAKAVYASIFKSLNEVRGLFGGPQIGGANEIESLKQFLVTPVESYEVYQTTAQREAVANSDPARGIGDTLDARFPLVLVRGAYYRDKKSLPYTVVDEYIVTKEDLPVFKRIYEGGFEKRVLEEDRPFVATRLILLYADILRGEWEKLIASDDNVPLLDDLILDAAGNKLPPITTPSEVKINNMKRIYYIANQLQLTYNNFIAKRDWSNAFNDAYNTYNGAFLLDNSVIEQVAVGRDAPRSNSTKIFDRTMQKVETLRRSFAIAPPDAPRQEAAPVRLRRPAPQPAAMGADEEGEEGAAPQPAAMGADEEGEEGAAPVPPPREKRKRERDVPLKQQPSTKDRKVSIPLAPAAPPASSSTSDIAMTGLAAAAAPAAAPASSSTSDIAMTGLSAAAAPAAAPASSSKFDISMTGAPNQGGSRSNRTRHARKRNRRKTRRARKSI